MYETTWYSPSQMDLDTAEVYMISTAHMSTCTLKTKRQKVPGGYISREIVPQQFLIIVMEWVQSIDTIKPSPFIRLIEGE